MLYGEAGAGIRPATRLHRAGHSLDGLKPRPSPFPHAGRGLQESRTLRESGQPCAQTASASFPVSAPGWPPARSVQPDGREDNQRKGGLSGPPKLLSFVFFFFF